MTPVIRALISHLARVEAMRAPTLEEEERLLDMSDEALEAAGPEAEREAWRYLRGESMAECGGTAK